MCAEYKTDSKQFKIWLDFSHESRCDDLFLQSQLELWYNHEKQPKNLLNLQTYDLTVLNSPTRAIYGS